MSEQDTTQDTTPATPQDSTGHPAKTAPDSTKDTTPTSRGTPPPPFLEGGGTGVLSGRSYAVDLTEPPEIGSAKLIAGKAFVLMSVEPYVRKSDGAASFVLTWRCEDGRIGTTGLRSKSILWAQPDAGGRNHD